MTLCMHSQLASLCKDGRQKSVYNFIHFLALFYLSFNLLVRDFKMLHLAVRNIDCVGQELRGSVFPRIAFSQYGK
jgi:hypothetical protein